MERALRRNITNIYLMSFFQNAMIITAIFVPLLQRHGLSMTEVLQTQALFALVVAVCEVPSGYLADLWGRKNTIAVGAGICCISFIYLLFADDFADFIIYEALMGIGISLCSGADLALLYDSQSHLNRGGHQKYKGDNSRHIARLVSIEGFAGGFAAILASILSLWYLDWVLWAQAIIGVLGFVFALSLVEAPRQLSAQSHSENWQQVYHDIVKNPLVLWTALAIIVFSLAALYTFWLYQKYWELQSIPVTWFGYIWACHCIIRGVTARFATEIEAALGFRNVFILIALLPMVGFFGMGSFGGWLGLAMALAFPVSRGLSLVVFYDALNRRVKANFRATINSLVSLGVRGIFITTGPILGYWVDAYGVQNSLLTLGVIFIPLFALVLLPLVGSIKASTVVPAKAGT